MRALSPTRCFCLFECAGVTELREGCASVLWKARCLRVLMGLAEIEFESTVVFFVGPQCEEQQFRKLRVI